MAIKKFLPSQFIKYCLVGTFGTGLDFLLLYSLVEYCHLFYFLAAAISIAIIVWISFTLNKFWTFQNFEKGYFVQFFKFILTRATAIGINLAVLSILVEIFDMWYILAKVFATAAALIWGFATAKKWVFGR